MKRGKDEKISFGKLSQRLKISYLVAYAIEINGILGIIGAWIAIVRYSDGKISGAKYLGIYFLISFCFRFTPLGIILPELWLKPEEKRVFKSPLQRKKDRDPLSF